MRQKMQDGFTKFYHAHSQLARPVKEGKDEQVLISNVNHLLIVQFHQKSVISIRDSGSLP